VNGRIKNWKFFAQKIPNTSLPFISDCLDIVCALINRYYCPAIANIENGREIAIQMRNIWQEENALQKRLQLLNEKTTLHWSKCDASLCRFPSLTENDVRNLTFGMRKFTSFVKTFLVLGSYQIKMAKSYIADHLKQSLIDEDIEFSVELCQAYDDLVRARFKSRHSNHKNYLATVQFNQNKKQPITG
jgi:hypothetical protein